MNQVLTHVQKIWATPKPANFVAFAAKQTMARMPEVDNETAKIEALIRFLYTADHRSPLEHVSLCVHITGVSRAFMSQITRHRLASYTCSSQHYQNYSDYPVIAQQYTKQMTKSIEEAVRVYSASIEDGIPKDQARMVLPEAMTVNMIMTANAREWATILNQRMCKRNTTETRHVAISIYSVCYDWFPELFRWVGPQCVEDTCKQGKMSCGEPYESPKF
jgi:thymidylate synthase (FAD)